MATVAQAVMGRAGRERDRAVQLRAVDLFAGAGGSSIGTRQAGVQIVGSVDADPVATATYADNFPGVKVLCDRLDAQNGPSLLGDVGPVDVIIASPECTNHSVARGARAIDEESRRSAIYILPFIDEWEPRYIVLENVTRVKKWKAWPAFLALLREAGYYVTVQELDAKDFGVPQSRRRLFVLCSREGHPREIRPPRRTQSPIARSIIAPHGTYPAQPVFGRKRPLAQATLERIARGQTALPDDDFLIVYYGTDAAGGWQSLDRPIRTLTTLDRFGLISGRGREMTLRMLQVPELRRAMGFPDSFRMEHGTRRDRVRLLGNGVCPPVMAAIIESLVQSNRDASVQLTDRPRREGMGLTVQESRPSLGARAVSQERDGEHLAEYRRPPG